ncbi:hypothetical protein VE03_06815 [Pseudogymnoascus sp. 23342-1-I1]|nr:hypothetical protein VE03_06815 [Pseudogymnoascus sp. 23342-1-I1]
MAASKPESPTRIQPHRAAKTPPKTPPIKDRVTKRSKSKSPKEGTTKRPRKTSKGGSLTEETDSDDSVDSFPKEGRDNFLKLSDIVVGNIISTGYHEAWTPQKEQDDKYFAKFVRDAGDGCGYVHSKYRKFVIIARFKKHFLSLPIYTNRLAYLDYRGDHTEHAEILDSTMKGAKLPRPRPLCRGSTDNIWLWSKAYSTAGHKWPLMDKSSVAWMARPVAHGNDIRAKVVSRLEKESEEQLLRWSRDCLLEGLEEQVRKHLRVLRRENVKPPEVPGPGPWGR